jgi:hypothetical protein
VLNGSKARLLFGAVLLGFCIFVASWAVVREITAKSAELETVASTIHKLVRGERLQDVRRP